MPEKSDPSMFDEMSKDRQEFLLKWIDENLNSKKGFNSSHTSYGLKQIIKDANGNQVYYFNGEFKGAMLKAGYDVADPNELNWIFNISSKSPIFKKQSRRSQ